MSPGWTEIKWSGRVDLNHRPPGPEPGALTGLRHAPQISRYSRAAPRDHGAPGGTRIPNLLIRSQMLYPIELQAPEKICFSSQRRICLGCGDTSAVITAKLAPARVHRQATATPTRVPIPRSPRRAEETTETRSLESVTSTRGSRT